MMHWQCKKIADSLGYLSMTILNEEATADRIISEIGQAVYNLEENGILLLTYSGHGGQMPDANGDEDDGKDETWVLYDRQLIDDELYNLWNQFNNGARIFLLSDSCHSGTISREPGYIAIAKSEALPGAYPKRSGPPRFRNIPPQIASANYQNNKRQYDALQFASGSRKRKVMECSVLLISGCQDNQLSSDGDSNGLFTEKLLNVWHNGAFTGNYSTFYKAILDQMPPTQTPKYSTVGMNNPTFEEQCPFTIDISSTPSMPASTWPSIQGPASHPRTGLAPYFSVNAGPGRYFAVEVATSVDLFDSENHGGDRNPSNFYGSWSDTQLMQGNIYDLPSLVWTNLKKDNILYYRVLSTTNSNGWDNYQVSSGDSDGTSVPSIQIY